MWRRLDRMRGSRFLAACNHNAEVKINSALSHSDNWLNIIYINQISLVCFHISVSKEGKYTTCPFAYYMGLGWRNTVSLGRLCITSQMIIYLLRLFSPGKATLRSLWLGGGGCCCRPMNLKSKPCLATRCRNGFDLPRCSSLSWHQFVLLLCWH